MSSLGQLDFLNKMDLLQIFDELFANKNSKIITKNDFLKIHFWTPFRQNFQKTLVPLEAQELADSKNGLEVMI